MLLLLPILVILWDSERRRALPPALLAGLGWVLLGPVHSTYLTLLADWPRSEGIMRPVVETGVAGMLCVWAGALLAAKPRAAAGVGERPV